MQLKLLTLTLPLAALPAAAFAAPAAQPIELSGEVRIVAVELVDGQPREVLRAPKVVVPGDRLVFHTAYRNAGGAPVRDFVVTNPVPAGVTVSGEGPALELVSIDGGKSWNRLAALSVTAADGSRRPAMPGDITHLRWSMREIPPGGEGRLTYHAIVR